MGIERKVGRVWGSSNEEKEMRINDWDSEKERKNVFGGLGFHWTWFW
jgi:hypothetical protein